MSYLGREHLLGVAYLPELGWYDLTLMDVPHLNLFADLSLAPVLFGVMLLFALLAVGWALRSWILKPIEMLRASTDKIGHGDFNVATSIKGGGEIAHLSRSFEHMAKFVMDSNRKLEDKVSERTEELRRLTEIDPMTGLLNRRGMLDRFESEIARQVRQGGSLGLLLLDLDCFKRINDSYGHSAGDLALCEAAKVLLSIKRAYDHAARWGGEEFLVLLPNCSEQDLLGIAERIRVGIAALQIDTGSQVFSFTVSIGAHHPSTPQTIDAMLQKVDSALYAAKDAGRNCVRTS
jgi:diguanylate cyclase (GGDEF)-like protein